MNSEPLSTKVLCLEGNGFYTQVWTVNNWREYKVFPPPIALAEAPLVRLRTRCPLFKYRKELVGTKRKHSERIYGVQYVDPFFIERRDHWIRLNTNNSTSF